MIHGPCPKNCLIRVVQQKGGNVRIFVWWPEASRNQGFFFQVYCSPIIVRAFDEVYRQDVHSVQAQIPDFVAVPEKTLRWLLQNSARIRYIAVVTFGVQMNG